MYRCYSPTPGCTTGPHINLELTATYIRWITRLLCMEYMITTMMALTCADVLCDAHT